MRSMRSASSEGNKAREYPQRAALLAGALLDERRHSLQRALPRMLVTGAFFLLALGSRNGDGQQYANSTLTSSTSQVAIDGRGVGAYGQENVQFPVPGTPPLTREMVQKLTNYFEWMLDARMTAEQRDQFRDSVVDSWKSGRQDEIQATVAGIQFADQLSGEKMSPQQREAYRQVLQAQYLAQMRSQPGSVLSRWILNIYDAAHKPLAPGNPPLTQQTVDAYAEAVGFMLRESMGKEYFVADRGFKDALARNLIARYAQLGPEQQAGLSQIPAMWAVTQATWPGMPESQKQVLRDQWRQGLQGFVAAATQSTPADNQAQAPSDSVNDMMNKEKESIWARSMSQSIMTNTMNIRLNGFH